MPHTDNTIIALSTPPGIGAIAIIRLSGPEAISIADQIFKGKKLAEQPSHTAHFGRIVAANGTLKGSSDQSEAQPEIVDEVVVSVFRSPNSYTGENVIEISCHGSPYIQQRIMEVVIAAGAIPAAPGEFTQRAFLHGKLDLTQAEAVGDLIAAESKAAQQSAMHQLRGGFSAELQAMREELITFSALIELELDFSQEDVAFADRDQLYRLLTQITQSTCQLINSFKLGNAVKNGVSVAIIGAPNAGKSTLLNALLKEERAIVSEIPGTTRDTIEEVINIDGILFRFIDTAGIRETTIDTIEQQGIARSLKMAESADVVIELVSVQDAIQRMKNAQQLERLSSQKQGLTVEVISKADTAEQLTLDHLQEAFQNALLISAKKAEGIDTLRTRLYQMIASEKIQPGATIITNTRHLAALQKIETAISDIKAGLDKDIPGDLIALDIRQALHYIGELTGQIQTDRDILGTIFGKFCIGK